jgi:hypothetical protein
LFLPSAQTEFYYAPDGSRYKRVDTVSGQVTTTLYIGNVERITRPTGVTELKRYLPQGTIVTTYSNQPGVVDDRYALPDHLGSIDRIVNRNGTTLEAMSFDAWGLRRNAETWSGPPATVPTTTTRGYSGHEHVDTFGYVHMNGRMYDPQLV